MSNYLDDVKSKRELKAAKEQRNQDLSTTKDNADAIVHAINQQGAKTRTTTQKVEVGNTDLAKANDVKEVVDSINKLNVTTFMANRDAWTSTVSDMVDAAERMQQVMTRLEAGGLSKIEKSFTEAVTSLKNVADSVKSIKIETDSDVKTGIRALSDSISKLDMQPVINVQSPQVVVDSEQVDLSPLTRLLEQISGQVAANKVVIPKNDFTSLERAIQKVTDSVNGLSFPIPNYVLPFKDVQGRATQVQLDASGNLPISASISGADGAITDGVSSTIKATVLDLTDSNPLTTAIVDSNGDQISSFGGGTQYTEGDSIAGSTGVGTLAMAQSIADSTAHPLKLDASGNLLVLAYLGSNNLALETGGFLQSINQGLNADGILIRGTTGLYSQFDLTNSDPMAVALVDGNGDQITSVGPEKAASATLANVSTSTTSANLLASNAARKKAVIVNDSAVVMYVKYGSTATATDYSYLLQPSDTLEETIYTGDIDGILASSTGVARVTEL